MRDIVRSNWVDWPFSNFKHTSKFFLGGLSMSVCLEIVEIIQRDANIDTPASGDK